MKTNIIGLKNETLPKFMKPYVGMDFYLDISYPSSSNIKIVCVFGIGLWKLYQSVLYDMYTSFGEFLGRYF